MYSYVVLLCGRKSRKTEGVAPADAVDRWTVFAKLEGLWGSL